MPVEARHVRAAEANEDLANALINNPSWPAWAVVLTFYSALHWVDACLAKVASIYPRSHDERDRYIARMAELRAIYDQYRTLGDRAREARYDLKAFLETEARQLLSNELADIRRHAQRLLG